MVMALGQARLGGFGRGVFVGYVNLAMHCVVFAMTFAVSGFFAALVAVLLLWGATTRMSATQGLKFVVFIVGIALVTTQVVGTIVGSTDVVEMFVARVSDVAGDESRVERRVISYLFAAPKELLLGFGPGNYNFVVREMDVQLAGAHGVDPLDSGVLTVLADFGIVGAIGLFVPVSRRLFRALKASRRGGGHGEGGRLLLAAGLGLVAMVQLPLVGALPYVLMFTGVAEAINDAGVSSRHGAVVIPAAKGPMMRDE
jgi:hypothetical protein